MKRLALSFLLGLIAVPVLTASSAQAQRNFNDGITVAEQCITEANLTEYLTYIASDELQGRNTPSPGLDMAAKYIADHVKSWGLKPGGDKGSYFQRIALSRRTVNQEKTTGTLGTVALKYGDDFLPRMSAGGTASGKVVYVGHGYVIPSKGVDAYKGVDVKGKFVVVTGGLPKDVPFTELNKMERGKDYQDVRSYAEAHGAAGILSLPSRMTADSWQGFRRGMERFGGGFNMNMPSKNGSKVDDAPKLMSVAVAPSLLEKLFAGEKTDAATLVNNKPDEPFDLSADKTLSLTLDIKQEEAFTQNVVAIVEGSDKTLKNEYVAFGAHYDHVGVGRADDRGDTIYNGADDDGSGTVSLIALAQAFGKSKVKPKRSIIFVWHCGEEKGLWGSSYFTQNPTVPLTSIITQLNIDMIGRSRADNDQDPRDANLSQPNEIYTIGSKMMSTELGTLAEQVNNKYLSLTYNYRYDDPNDPNRFFYRSDHYNYAKAGVPIIFWFDGVHADYHRPSDEVSKIDFVKMSKVARTVFLTGVELANLDKRPVVDKTLDR